MVKFANYKDRELVLTAAKKKRPCGICSWKRQRTLLAENYGETQRTTKNDDGSRGSKDRFPVV